MTPPEHPHGEPSPTESPRALVPVERPGEPAPDDETRVERLRDDVFDRYVTLTYAAFDLPRGDVLPGDTQISRVLRTLPPFRAALREYERECPRLRIRERLTRAVKSGVAGLNVAAYLLSPWGGPEGDALADALARAGGSSVHRSWPNWLSYVIEQILNSGGKPWENAVPAGTSREDLRKADAAFGCVLLSDETFTRLQAVLDREAIVEGARHGGADGRPVTRVRDFINETDHRALAWLTTRRTLIPAPPPPVAVRLITEPTETRQALLEVWSAASVLRESLYRWMAWFAELREHGDADPAEAMTCAESARWAVEALLIHRPNAGPFDRADRAELERMLPPLPDWSLGGGSAREGDACDVGPKPPWYEDASFLALYFGEPEGRHDPALGLYASTGGLLRMLENFPLAAVRRAGPGEARRPDAGQASILPHHRRPGRSWPLVGERTARRGASAELAKDEDRHRQSRYCQGFAPDWWMPATSAGEWRSPLYPLEATRESVRNWMAAIDEMRVEYLGPFDAPGLAAELAEKMAGDLSLIRRLAPHLVEPESETPATAPNAAGISGPPPAAPPKLTFEPGAFFYRGHRQQIGGKPLQVLQALSRSRVGVLSIRDLRDQIWPDSDSGDEAIKAAMSSARKALRSAMEAAGVSEPEDPLPVVDRGGQRSAWRLDLP